MESHNFYLMLGLPIEPAEHDYEVIKKAIQKKRASWNRKSLIITFQVEAEKNLTLLKAAEESMKNRVFREQEAKAAIDLIKKEKLKQQKESTEKLNRYIHVLSQKGFIYEHELVLMEKEFNLTRKQIKGKLKAVRIKKAPTTNEEQQKEAKQVYSKEKMSQIKSMLRSLNIGKPQKGTIPTLYDLLQMPETSRTEELNKKAKDSHELLTKKGAVIGIANEKNAYSQAEKVFMENPSRLMYDEALKIERFQPVADIIKIAGSTNVLDQSVYKELVKQALNEGLLQLEAEESIKSLCKQENIMIKKNKEKRQGKLTFHQCGVCGQVNDSKGNCCIRCGSDFTIGCKKCNTKNQTHADYCSNCGISFADLHFQEKLVKQADLALVRYDLESAADYLEQARFYWSSNEGLKKLDQRMKTFKEQQKDQIHTIQKLVTEKKFYSAEKELLRVKGLNPKLLELAAFERNIKNRINMAEVYLHRAETLSNEQHIIQCYLQALELCTDCQEAVQKLNQFPPVPPSDVKVMEEKETIRLEWSSLYKIENGSYIIERQEGTGLRKKIGETVDYFFIDKKAEAGKQYFYTIHTKQGEKVSENVTKGPLMRTAEVENLKAFSHLEGIMLTWKAIATTKVQVWRKEGSIPTKQGDGMKLYPDTNSIMDKNVSKENVYGYLVIAEYDDGHGRAVFSKGRGILAVNAVTEAPSITIDEQPDEVFFNWKNPENATVSLFYSEYPFEDIETNECLSYTQFVSHLEGKPLHPMAAGKAKKTKDFSGLLNILPITKYEDCVIVGKPFVIKSIEPVSQVNGKLHDQGEFLLSWKWPEYAEKVTLRYSEKGFNDPSAQNRECRRSYYESFNGFKIDNLGKDKTFFSTLYVTEELDGVKYFSKAVNYRFPEQGTMEIRYSLNIKKKKLWSLKKQVMLTIHVPETGMPDLVVVGQKGRTPNVKNDGHIIKTIHAKKGIGEHQVDLTEYIDEDTYVKLFFSDDNDSQYHTIVLEPNAHHHVF